MSFKAGFRPLRAFHSFRTTFRQSFSRRWQTTASDSATAPVKENRNPFDWNSPVGPKTVHFWAPVMKWILVGVSISDFTRPAESLSLMQSGALMATGAIWTRWCLIIKPKNYLLAAVNFFLFLANSVQVGRVVNYRLSIKNTSVAEEAKGTAKDTGKAVEGLVKDTKDTIQTAISK